MLKKLRNNHRYIVAVAIAVIWLYVLLSIAVHAAPPGFTASGAGNLVPGEGIALTVETPVPEPVFTDLDYEIAGGAGWILVPLACAVMGCGGYMYYRKIYRERVKEKKEHRQEDFSDDE